MEIGLAITVSLMVGQCHREYTVRPLVLDASHVEITTNRIETEMIVFERPETILPKTVDVQSIVGQIGQISVRIIAMATHNVWRYAGDAMTVGNYARWNFKAFYHLIRL